MNDILQALKCAQCGGGPLKDEGNGTITCPFCGSTFAHPERVCPRCETVNEADARECVSCGEKLREPCVRCGTLNWAQAQYCQRCGAALGVLEHIAARRSKTEAERLRGIQSEAPRLKEETERSSQERLARLWATENERLSQVAKNQARQQSQERLIWIIAATGIILMLIAIVALAVMTQVRPH